MQNQIILNAVAPILPPPPQGAVALQVRDGVIVGIGKDGGKVPSGSPTPTGTPVYSVKATGTLTATATAPANGDTVTIGGKVYTFQTTLTNVNGNVLIGVSAAVALDNLKAAVNLDAGAGTTFATATTIHPTVTATTNTNTTQVFEAKTAGVIGNAITTTEVSTQLSFGAATLTGGIDATVAQQWDQLVDASNLYVATTDITTTSTTGWKKTALAGI